MSFSEHSLFPRDNQELAGACFQQILKVLAKEQKARGRDYQLELPGRQPRVREIEEAITKLKQLYRLAVENLRK